MTREAGETCWPTAVPTRKRRRLPDALLHARRIRHALAWLRAFLEGNLGILSRSYKVAPSSEPCLRIAVDASPWGFGTILSHRGNVQRYLADSIRESDLRCFNARKGDSKFMTTWEALAILVSIRTWLPDHRNVVVEVRSDSLSAFRLVVKICSPNPGLNRNRARN